VFVDTYGTALNGKTDEELSEMVLKNFDLRPGVIIKELGLKRPIFAKTAAGGHFGRNEPEFTWETPKCLHE
jgi:S-adenosylmethionine synthetase